MEHQIPNASRLYRYSYIYCLAFILVSTILLTDCKAQSSPKVDWDKLLKAWSAYLDYPSSENADKITVLLPDSGYVIFTNDPKEHTAFDSISQNLSMLEYQIYSGDSSAVNLAFRFYSIADGEFAEALDIILGNLIRINPQLLLEELSFHQRFLESIGRGLTLDNFGDEFVDKLKASRLETNLRIKALEKITQPSLINVRDHCIKTLKEELERLEAIKE